jgi:hypothetical protein
MRPLLGCAVLGLTLLAANACGTPAASCQDAEQGLLDAIARGATAAAAFDAVSGKTLQSPDDENVYVVAATTKAADGTEKTGVWATSDLVGEGSVQSVDDVAKELTTYADSSTAATGISPGDAVVSDVRACL